MDVVPMLLVDIQIINTPITTNIHGYYVSEAIIAGTLYNMA